MSGISSLAKSFRTHSTWSYQECPFQADAPGLCSWYQTHDSLRMDFVRHTQTTCAWCIPQTAVEQLNSTALQPWWALCALSSMAGKWSWSQSEQPWYRCEVFSWYSWHKKCDEFPSIGNTNEYPEQSKSSPPCKAMYPFKTVVMPFADGWICGDTHHSHKYGEHAEPWSSIQARVTPHTITKEFHHCHKKPHCAQQSKPQMESSDMEEKCWNGILK